ncbi:hypothetical protein [Maricaulis parjimensis]|uniref:hypothetical protein n=1 Tax=Maricaulis parjimensis TaxID=144023 RepID=UPI0019398FCA|nr:hypothetical protein [Maricaulis parjimensis]
MKRFLTLALVCAGISACTTTTTGPSGYGMAMTAVDDVRANEGQITSFGYELSSFNNWDGRMSYLEEDGQARVSLRLRQDGGEADYVDLAIAMPYLDGGVRRFYGHTAGGERVAVELQAGPCEAAPGNGHTYFAVVSYGGETLSGCGREVARDDNWSNYLMSYLPAIDACLDEMGDRARHVSVAYTLPGGNIAIRLVDRETQTWECATREEGMAINSLRQLDGVDIMHGEGDPIFVRGEYPDFGEGCYVYETVRLADGSLVGSFGFDTCNATLVSSREPGVG